MRNTLHVLNYQYSPWIDDKLHEKSLLFRTLEDVANFDIVYIEKEDINDVSDKPWVTECFLEQHSIEEFWFSFPDNLQYDVRRGIGTIILSNYRYSQTIDAFWYIHDLVKKHGQEIPFDNMIYAVGSISAMRDWKEWKDIEFLTPPHMLNIVQFCADETFDSFMCDADVLKQYNPVAHKARDKMFTCLNHKIRDHRILTIAGLAERKLLNKGYVSFCSNDGEDTLGKYTTVPTREELIQSSISYLENKLPLVADYIGTDMKYKQDITSWLLQDSYFSIITMPEFFITGVDDHRDTSSFGRAIIKPIINKQPFLVAAPHLYLSDLQKYGYETFSEWIDESYDNEPDDLKRLDMMLDEAERLAALPRDSWDSIIESMFVTLENNFRRFENAKTEQYTNEHGLCLFEKYTN